METRVIVPRLRVTPQRGDVAYIITEHADPLPRCSACGRPLNEDGVPLHTPYKRIILPRAAGECLP